MTYLKSKMDSVRLSVQSAHVNVHRAVAPMGRCNPYITVKVVQAGSNSTEAGEGGNGVEQRGRVKARTKTQLRTLFPL
jgi:hypothetical protein